MSIRADVTFISMLARAAERSSPVQVGAGAGSGVAGSAAAASKARMYVLSVSIRTAMSSRRVFASATIVASRGEGTAWSVPYIARMERSP